MGSLARLFTMTVCAAVAILPLSARTATMSRNGASAGALESGIQTQYLDRSVRPQDDFYQFVNGKWLKDVQIPADKGRFGTFDKLQDDAYEQLHQLMGQLIKRKDLDPEQRKVADFYLSFMDEAAIEKRGAQPLEKDFARIDAITDRQQIPALIAYLNQLGLGSPINADVSQDARDAARYAFRVSQGGLGLPDRDYYLQDDPQFKKDRSEYVLHMARMLGFIADEHAWQDAQSILALETQLARIQWTRVQNRDPVKAYNKVELNDLPGTMPGFDWGSFLRQLKVNDRVSYVIISEPDYFTHLAGLLQSVPLQTWKVYFRWHVLNDYAPFLSKRFVDENFAFRGTVLRGATRNLPRWKRGLQLLDGAMGEALGKLYVAHFFPPRAKERADALVHNLLAAYKADIDTLDWMGPQTKIKAQAKLAKLTTKIGYPRVWRDYSTLSISRGDLLANVQRAALFDDERNRDKLGKPVDHDEWTMTPQTVNAYYNAKLNEIVFPAAILRPPYFNPNAEDAVNYGGIGGVIGHEISHGFDDSGSQYDGGGNLLGKPGWFTDEDLERFKAKTHALVAQYSAEEPVPGFHINGELTLGENIADTSGLAIAYKAYELSLGGRKSPVIDGFTGEQRVFIGWAQVWRGKGRTDDSILRLKSDPHSPQRVRGTAVPRNQAAFYEAFGIKPGDPMYLPPDKRVSLW